MGGTDEPASATDAADEERVVVGLIRRPHGLRGELVVEPCTDLPDRFAPGSVLRCGVQRLVVAASRPHRDVLLVRFEGRGDREAVAPFAGGELSVARSEVPPAPAGLCYTFELVGCRCRDAVLGDLGVVREVVADGGGYLLQLEGPRGTLLVPFVDAFIEALEMPLRRIDLRLPEGLVEACGSE